MLGQGLHVAAECAAGGVLLELAAFVRRVHRLGTHPVEGGPGVRQGQLELLPGRADRVVRRRRSWSSVPVAQGAVGAAGSFSTPNEWTIIKKPSLTMFRAFQKTVITLRALLIRVMASLAVLISFAWPQNGM